MGNIVLLDDLTINKIAAGEVIERPASVVKEMVENSIDAGATNICVEIQNGGISSIRITDNGKGIAPDDLEIAFERHATSKLREASQLTTIKSMGFRGEALASIAAIANVEMISRQESFETGNRIVVEGGRVLEINEIGCPIGTTINVKNLFFNTPVRYKFLKKDFTESGYIEDIITRLALVNTNIAFKLVSSGKTIIQTNGNGDIKSVIYSIFGKDIASAIVNVDYEYEGMHVTGVVGKPEIARSNRTNQIFYVNKRNIKDKSLSSATEQAFKGLLPIGKYGFLVLNIEMSSEKVDVNVHPTKSEVRFEEEGKVFKAIYHAIRDALLKTELVENVEKEEIEEKIENPDEFKMGNFLAQMATAKVELEEDTVPHIDSNEIAQKEETLKLKVNDILRQLGKLGKEDGKEELASDEIILPVVEVKEAQEDKEEITLPEDEKEKIAEEIENVENKELEEVVEEIFETPETETERALLGNITEKEENNEENKVKQEDEKFEKMLEMTESTPEKFEVMYETIFGKVPTQKKNQIINDEISAYEIIKDNNMSVFEDKKIQKAKYKLLGVAFSTYIIIEIDNEIYIIDQHAAHERIMYEKVKENFYSDKEKDAQILLLPDIITLTHKEMEIARENYDTFIKAGFELEEFGENTIKLTAAPNVCIELDTKELFLETLDELNTVARTAKQEIEEKFIATIACKAAVKAKMALTNEEIDSLMQQLLNLPNPFTCPHGRPTAIKMTKTDIEKKFARRK